MSFHCSRSTKKGVLGSLLSYDMFSLSCDRLPIFTSILQKKIHTADVIGHENCHSPRRSMRRCQNLSTCFKPFTFSRPKKTRRPSEMRQMQVLLVACALLHNLCLSEDVINNHTYFFMNFFLSFQSLCLMTSIPSAWARSSLPESLARWPLWPCSQA